MKKSVKRQERSKIMIKEFHAKVNSLFEMMGKQSFHPTSDVTGFIKAKHFPYANEVTGKLVLFGFLLKRGVAATAEFKVVAEREFTMNDSTKMLRLWRERNRQNKKEVKALKRTNEPTVSQRMELAAEAYRVSQTIMNFSDTTAKEERVFFVTDAIALLKSKGYKILKPVQTFEEV
jgi:hypothetical protein